MQVRQERGNILRNVGSRRTLLHSDKLIDAMNQQHGTLKITSTKQCSNKIGVTYPTIISHNDSRHGQ